ncbi:MAG: helix-turn-helix domain-containing protein [Ilumatobacteraceae bacterium]
MAASLEQMRRNGYAGTGVKAILVAAEAPFGSLYHHFPGGKEEVGAETIRRGGVAYGEPRRGVLRRWCRPRRCDTGVLRRGGGVRGIDGVRGCMSDRHHRR